MKPKSANDPPAWTVLESNVAYDGKWWRLRTDRCQTAGGRIVSQYPVFEYPDWISLVAFRREDCKVILTHEYRHGAGRTILGLPGGTVEPDEIALGEAGLLCAAWRELLEETGYGNGKLLPLLKASPNPATYSNTITSYIAFDVQQVVKPMESEDEENIGVIFHDFPTLLDEINSGRVFMDATQVAAILSAAISIVRNRVPELRSLADAISATLMGPQRS